jgi:hypothetical protein
MATCRFRIALHRWDSRYAWIFSTAMIVLALFLDHFTSNATYFAGLVDRLSHIGRHESSRAERVLYKGIASCFRATALCGRLVARARVDGHLYDPSAGRPAQLVEGHCARQVDHGHHCDGLFHAPGGMIQPLVCTGSEASGLILI